MPGIRIAIIQRQGGTGHAENHQAYERSKGDHRGGRASSPGRSPAARAVLAEDSLERSAQASRSGVTRVSSVDDSGRDLLGRMYQWGVEFVAVGPETAAMVEEIMQAGRVQPAS